MPIGNRGLQGQPGLPYIDYRSYAGVDVFLDLTFLDHTGVTVIPASITYQVDNMTNAVNMIPPTTLVSNGNAQQTLQLPGSQMVMFNNFSGSQICQVYITAVLSDGSTIKSVTVVELCGIQTPIGSP